MQEWCLRQLAEVQAMESIWSCDGEFLLDDTERADFRLAEEIVENGWSCKFPTLSGRVLLKDSGAFGIGLRFTLPAGYPGGTAPRLQVESAAPREVHGKLTLAVEAAVEEQCRDGIWDECLLVATEALKEAAATILSSRPPLEKTQKNEAEGSSRGTGSVTPTRLGRRVLWFHHIKALTKRKAIVGWAREMHLGGFSKPGFPGIIVVEGEEDSVAEYVARIKSLRWQAMAVRAEETEVIDEGACDSGAALEGARKLPAAFEELSESGMTELGQACRDAQLEHLFLAAMKIAR